MAILVALVLGLLVGPVVGIVVGLLVGAAVAYQLRRSGPGTVSRAVGGRAADPERDARLVNLVDGLGSAAGVPPPRLLVVEDPAPNAMSYGLAPRSATLVVTTGLLERLSRVELEGVLARELARIKNHDTEPGTVAAAVLRLLGSVPPVARRVRSAGVGTPALFVDAQGAGITRYPPGLAAALTKVRADGAEVRAGSPATAHLWIAPPGEGSDVHPPLEERIEALREL